MSDLEDKVDALSKRVGLLEGEIRVFTPPISRLEKMMWESSSENSQRFDSLDRRIDTLNRKVDGLRGDFNAKSDQMISLLRELINPGT